MRDWLIFLLVVAVGVLGFVAYSQQEQIHELSGKPKAAGLELQDKCAKQAHEVFKSEGWTADQHAGFENHYSEKMNRCFIAEHSMSNDSSGDGSLRITMEVLDAFELKLYAAYGWQSEKDKNTAEIAPFICNVTIPSGGHTTCHSDREYDDLTKAYMQ